MPLNRAFLDLCNLNAPSTKSFKSLFTVSFYLFIYLFVYLFIYLLKNRQKAKKKSEDFCLEMTH